ncbi:MAG: membrane protein insertion efficiency factor YidD [Agarilytica sp.]
MASSSKKSSLNSSESNKLNESLSETEALESEISVLQKCLVFICLLPIRFYRYFISPMLGPKCRFEPTCSHYAEIAIKQHGPFIGMYLAIKRLLKCHPWHPGGYDPVPNKQKPSQEH